MKSDVDGLLREFAAGRLVRPDADALNSVDFSLAVARWGGVDGVADSPGRATVSKLIGEPDHLVVVAVDGLGMNMLDALPPGSFLRSRVATAINAPYPSTTSVTFTTYTTGLWPAEHAVTSWFVHLPEIGGPTVILPYVRRSDGASLEQLGILPRMAFPSPSLLNRFTTDGVFVMPDDIAGSVFSRYQSGRFGSVGYVKEDPASGAEIVANRIRSARRPTFVSMYTALLDMTAHESGANHGETMSVAAEIDRVAGDLARAVSGRARVLVMSDHGHLDLPSSGARRFEPGGRLDRLLSFRPAGDARIGFFHVRDGEIERFAEEFRGECADDFFVLTADELDELRLLGPMPMGEITRRRVGDVIAISRGAAGLEYRAAGEPGSSVSAHSGLTVEEMRIPLVVA